MIYNEDLLDTALGYNKLHNAGTRLTGNSAYADRVAQGLQRSSVTPAHMRGLQFIHLTDQAPERAGGIAHYNPDTRTIRGFTGHASWDDDDSRTYNLNHEIGHHVAESSHGITGSPGYNEAVAENFAERHSPRSNKIGDRYRMDPRSHYDQNMDDPVYHQTRMNMVQPHERPDF